MASIQKRGGNSYLLVVENGYKANGKRDRRTRTIRVKDEKILRAPRRLQNHLEKELLKFELEIETGEYISPERLLIRDFVEEWKTKHAEVNLAGKTRMNYYEKLDNYILPRFGYRKLSELTPKHIVDFIHDVSQPGAAVSGRKEPLGDSTIYEIDKTLRVILNKAVEWRMIKESPMEGLSRPSIKKKRMKYYEAEDVIKFMEAMYREEPVWRMYFITAAISGMRRGEVIALRWSDLDFEKGHIKLFRSIPYFEGGKPHVKSTKTNEDIRIVTMPDWYFREMGKYKEIWDEEKEFMGDNWEGGDDDYLFHGGKGIPYLPETATRTWGKIKKKHKLKNIRLHDLRHTMITFLFESGEKLINIQERAGHSSSKITSDIYGHVSKRASKSTAKWFDKFDPAQFVNNSSTSEILSTSTDRRNAYTSRFKEGKQNGAG